MPQRQGLRLSLNTVHLLRWKAQLQVLVKKRSRRRSRRDLRTLKVTGPYQVWAYDCVFDTCINGQQLKCLTVVDEWSRESLAIKVSGSIRAENVIKTLQGLVARRGAPSFLRSDNGPEFVAYAGQDWLKKTNIRNADIRPGKPWYNGLKESLCGCFRDECLNLEWFHHRREAALVITFVSRLFDPKQ